MSEPYDVLVVCEGNLCRSPLAERLLTSRLAGAEVRVASAGVHAVVGAPMDASAAAELTRLGGDPSEFEARQLTASMATEADLVLTATRAIRGQVVATAPAALKRTFTLLELAALLEAPPWDGPRERRRRDARPRRRLALVGQRPRRRPGRPGPDRPVASGAPRRGRPRRPRDARDRRMAGLTASYPRGGR